LPDPTIGKSKMTFKSLKLYWKKITKLFQRSLTRIAVGMVVGFIIGIILLVILQQNVSAAIIFIAAAFAGVFAEIFVRFAENVFALRTQLRPLNQVLGTIATEDTWVYISAWRRDLDDLEHSRLYRNDPERQDQPLIIGSKYVYGRGDATALSYVSKAVEKASKGKTQIFVEDSERTYDEWNKSAICIGAHNSKTREILDKFTNTFFKFEANYKVIVEVGAELSSNQDGVQFVDGVKQTKAQDSSDIDYAILLKLRDEYHPGKNIIVLAGLGDSGTAGAAYYLLNHFDKLPHEKDTFGVLIEVPSGPQSAREIKFSDIARPTIIGLPIGSAR
jgi:hypothetical protein